MVKYAAIWALAGLIYAGFLLWHSGGSAPLTRSEITAQLADYARLYRDGAQAERRVRLRGFLAGDDGGEVIAVHLVRMRARPEPIGNVQIKSLSSFAVLRRYTDIITWPLFARASYPLLVAPAISLNLEEWGVAEPTAWTHIVIMRHRSRRDMMALITDPRFASRYQFALAAIESQIAFAAAPAEQLLMLQPPIVMAWIIFALAALVQIIALVQNRR